MLYPFGAEIKQGSILPVIGVGMIKDPSYADKIIEEEKVDLIAWVGP